MTPADYNDAPHYEEGAAPKAETSIVARPNNMQQTAGAQALVQRTLGEVQVAVMMAKQFPRDKIVSREKLINDCCREGLALKSTYSYARGGTDIVGPTIRFAEAVKNAWGNLQSGYRELGRSKGPDGVGQSEVEAFAWDTENNTRQSTVFFVRHWRDTKKGGYALTDERDIRELIANQAKRLERTCILNSIDGDITEAGLEQCTVTLKTKVKVTPELITSIITKFEEYGVSKEQIQQRIQRRIEAINPALVISLTKIYNSMKDGMSKPEEWFEAEKEEENKSEKKGGNEKAKNKLREKAKTDGADPDTGEIIDKVAKQNTDAAASDLPPEEKPEEEDVGPPLNTLAELKAAASALITALRAAPVPAKAGLFVQSHGMLIVDKLKEHNQQFLINHIKEAGIKLP